MFPFESYPGGGRKQLGIPTGSNCRHEYGLQFMARTGQRHCAYCENDLTESYESWLTMALDHVVPVSVCKAMSISHNWYWDFSNLVLACTACNGFCNRYKTSDNVSMPQNLEVFYELRDTIFDERKRLVKAKHEEERRFFEGRPWERHQALSAI
jgi:hypothetical protein